MNLPAGLTEADVERAARAICSDELLKTQSVPDYPGIELDLASGVDMCWHMWTDQARAALTAAIGDRVVVPDAPVAWLHTLHMELDQSECRLTFDAAHPFGLPDKDYSPEYTVTSQPLYSGTKP